MTKKESEKMIEPIEPQTELQPEIIPDERPLPVIKAGLFSRFIGTVTVAMNTLSHKTYLHVFDDCSIYRYKCEETIHTLKSKKLVVVKETAPLVDSGGCRHYFAYYGESVTTDKIELKRRIFAHKERDLQIYSDQMRRTFEYNHIENMVKSQKFAGLPLMVIIMCIGCGIAIGWIGSGIIGGNSDGDDITVNGDYNETKTENNDNSGSNTNQNGNNGDTVIVP